jgi:POT family proton-dependent oligopeptide transporter
MHAEPRQNTTPGHPPGLRTLFFTEMWERLSYYGMRALLVLFMVDEIGDGGMGLSDKTAAGIYGLYTAAVYLAALPGGWLADRLLGARRAVSIGAGIIATGHFVLAVPGTTTFYLGLVLVAAGTGLLKPNVSTLVGDLYPEGGARRDAGFTWFYLGINLGAALGPLVCSLLGEGWNWHYGFAAAGVGMVLGLLQFQSSHHRLGTAGAPPHQPRAVHQQTLAITAIGIGAIAVTFVLTATGTLTLDPVRLANHSAVAIVGLAIAWFAWAFLAAGLDRTEKSRLAVIALLFLASALFWAGFEQAGSSLNLFASRHTLRTIPGLPSPIPAGWFQSLNAVFVITLAPVMAAAWLTLARRRQSFPLVAKLALGLAFLAAGFLVIALGARQALTHGPVWPTWLIATYLLHTLGELLLSPVGLSSVTQLAPRRLAGQMMGIWFLATSLGNLFAGLFAGQVSGDNTASMPARFLQVAAITGIAALALLLLARPIQRRISLPPH